jgi:hypothetical protein
MKEMNKRLNSGRFLNSGTTKFFYFVLVILEFSLIFIFILFFSFVKSNYRILCTNLRDGKVMNCSLGMVVYIDSMYEKYNLTDSNLGNFNLNQFKDLYINTTGSPVVKEFNLERRTNDLINDVHNETYWRIYVPTGVGGTCNGNMVFGATQPSEL